MIDTNSSDNEESNHTNNGIINESNHTSENGIINENFVASWNTSPFPPSFYAPVENLVSLIKLDPNRLHNSPFDISQSSMTQVEIDPGDVTPAAVQQTEPLLTVHTNKRVVRAAGNSEPSVSVETTHKLGTNSLKIVAILLFIISIVILSHLVWIRVDIDNETD